MSNSVLTIVIVAIVSSFIFKIYREHLAFKKASLAKQNVNSEQDSSLLQQVEQLNERVEVLEKIVTDEGYQVQKDINNL